MYLEKYKKIRAYFVVFLMTAITWNFILFYAEAEYGAPSTNGETTNVWYIEYGDHITRENETLILNGNLIINSSGTLELSKVQLVVNSTSSNRYYIWVKPGGTLNLLSTKINSYNIDYSYEFIVEGDMYMENCTLDNLYGIQSTPTGGIQLYSNSVIIDSKINSSLGTGIYINESTPTIYNTTVSNCYYGIYFAGPVPVLGLSPSKVDILTNRSVQFNVTGGDPPYTWNSSNTTVGTINSTGFFTSQNIGGSIITVADNNTTIGKALVQVIPESYTSMKISPTYAVLNIDDDLQFNVTNGTAPLNWTVDNSTFGSIDQNGSYTAKWEGISVVQVVDANNTTISALVEIEDITNNYEDSLIMKNTILNNEIGMVLHNASPEISDTKFISNEIGLKLIESYSSIFSCKFVNNNADINVSSNSFPDIYLTEYNWSKISAPDNDTDSMPDYFEYQYGLNNSNSSDSNLDYDSDGLTNLEEFQNGTDPINMDTDSDGMNDSAELNIWNTNPFSGEEYLILNNNLTIDNNQALILSNSYLIMNSTASDTYMIWVKPGGNLSLYSTEIKSYNANYPYEFKVEGNMTMSECSVFNINGSSNEPKSGIQLYSDSIIINSEIDNFSGSGIYINQSNPTIFNTSISNCYYGIYIDDSAQNSENSTITNNSISQNDFGIVFNSSSINISNNELSTNDISIKFIDSSPGIDLSVIINSIIYDLEVDSNSLPIINLTEYDYSRMSAPDSDFDGMPDWYELQHGLNPNDPNDANLDQDNDNLVNLEEFQFCTSSEHSDTDFDTISDYFELINYSSSPILFDTDFDVLNDDGEVQNGVYWFEAEDNLGSGGISVEDPTANDPKPKGDDAAYSASGGDGEVINVEFQGLSIENTYLYYIKARLKDGEPAELKIRYTIQEEDYDVTKTIYDNYYRWYKFDSIITLTHNIIYLSALDVSITERIYVDKGVFVRISNDKPMEVTTISDDSDNVVVLEGGQGTTNLEIPIQGLVRRYVTKASMNIKVRSEETGFGAQDGITGQENKYPDIAVTSGGDRIHVVFQNYETGLTGDSVQYIGSNDGGSSWTLSHEFSNPPQYDAGYPSIDVYDDNIHVVYATVDDLNERKIYYSKNEKEGDDNEWPLDDTRLSDIDDSYEPNIAVDGKNVHVVWYTSPDDDEIVYSKSSTNGDSWGIVDSIRADNTAGGSPNKPDIGVDSSNVHVVFNDDDPDGQDCEVDYMRLYNNGNTAVQREQLTDGNNVRSAFGTDSGDSTGCIAVDGKNVHAVWVDYPDLTITEVYYKRSTDNGRTWDNVFVISASPGVDSIDPSIVVDVKNSLLYVFWSEDIYEEPPGVSNYQIKYRRSTDNGVTWGSAVELSEDLGKDSRFPKAAADGTGKIHVVWNDFSAGTLEDGDICYNYINNNIPALPTLDVGDDSTVDYTPGNYEVMYPIYDFSAELNDYIANHEYEIDENGYISIPLKFSANVEETIELLDISVQLGPDISDPNDPDTDADETKDGKEKSKDQGLFHPEYQFHHFEAAPAILQYSKWDSGSTSYKTETRRVIGRSGEDYGLYFYEDNNPIPIKKALLGKNIVCSPAIADVDNDKELEIVVGTVEGWVYILDVNGNTKWSYDTSVFDINIPQTTPIASPFYSSPAIANIVQNKYLEIVMVNYIGRIYCFDYKLKVLWIEDPLIPKSTIYWEETTPSTPSPTNTPGKRSDFGMATIHGTDKVLLFGGKKSPLIDDTWVYDLSTKTWTDKNPSGSKPNARESHAMATIWGTDKVVLFGGRNSTNFFDDTWVYDFSANSWTKMNPSPPKPSKRIWHAMASIHETDKVVLFGGCSIDWNYFDDTWEYDYSSDEWTEKKMSIKPNAREGHSMATIYGTDNVVLFGGRNFNGITTNYLDDTWEYNSNTPTNKWIKLTFNPIYIPTKRSGEMASIWNDDKAFLFGGYGGSLGMIYDNWVYDQSNNIWTLTKARPNTKPSVRHSFGMEGFYDTNKIILHAGLRSPALGVIGDTWIGELFYRDPYNADTYSSPVIGDLNNNDLLEIIICNENGKIYCLNHKGDHIWIGSKEELQPYDTGSPIKSTPAIGDLDRDGYMEIVVGCDDGKIYCIDYEGKLKWTFNTYSPIRSSPSIANVDISTEELEVVIGSDNGVTYCLNSDGTLNWQFPAVGEGTKGAFSVSPSAVDLNSFPDGGYETVAMSADGHIYCLDTAGAVDEDYSYYALGTGVEYPTYIASSAIADTDGNQKVEIIMGAGAERLKESDDYESYPEAIKWGMFGAGPKHNGNGDNRFAILIEGSKGIKANPNEPFQQEQFEANIREMAKMLTEHENNIKPEPGYTGYYLQDQIFYVGIHDDYPKSTCDYPYLERDKQVTQKMGLKNIFWAIQEVARKSDSYDKVLFFYTGYGGTQSFGGTTEYFFDADNSNSITPIDLTPDINSIITIKKLYGLDNYLDTIECKDMTIILQPDFSGDWIDELKRDKITSTTYKDETNRVIITSDKAGESRTNGKEYDFDLCNKEISSTTQVYYVGWWIAQGKQYDDGDAPKIDYEEYNPTSGQTVWQYELSKYNDELYEIEREKPSNGIDFYENWGDNGVEFVSGLTEAIYIDRFTQSTVQSNDILDADESTTNALNGYSHFPSISGYSNDYISSEESYNFMKLWHLGYRLNKNGAFDPWYDEPKIEYTYLEEGNNYLF